MKMTAFDIECHNARVAAKKMHKHYVGPLVGGGVEVESDLHNAIIEQCKFMGWIYLHGSMAAASHRTLGEPDFVVIANNGRVFFIECKSRDGKLSPAQQAMIHHAANLGTTIHIVRSIGQFNELTK